MLKSVTLVWRCPYLHDRHEFGTLEAVTTFVERNAKMKPSVENRKIFDRLRSKLLRVLRDPKGRTLLVDVLTRPEGADVTLTVVIAHRLVDYYKRTFTPGVEPPAESMKLKFPRSP
jgi:hypothetical protein